MTPTEYEQLVEVLDHRFAAIALRFDRMDQQFGEVREDIADLRGTMLGHFDAVYGRLERLEQEYHAITQALRRIELAFADEQGRREILQRDVAELKQQVAGLQSRIAEIEQQLRA
jgi:chromosome segregation ATPase